MMVGQALLLVVYHIFLHLLWVPSMGSTKNVSARELERARIGYPCDMFLEPFTEGAYVRFIRSRLLQDVPDDLYPSSAPSAPTGVTSSEVNLLSAFCHVFCYF